MEKESYKLIYATTATANDAERIGRRLVEERLVACVNLLDGMKSIYWWQDQICEASECVLLAKTRSELVQTATERIVELHSYDCPCVIVLPITDGAPGFLDWLGTVTKGEAL